ncbi:MAG: rRNA pseudouridine synthase [Candidatus Omnitrophica bacterium]|nr:rRNA pseudouridine synthase [Candidatus Omnitrophota bacterium]
MSSFNTDISPKVKKRGRGSEFVKADAAGGIMGQVPLERALSKLGVASRRQTKEWIESGRIKVDGRTIKDPLFLVVPEKARIALDGKNVIRAVSCTVMLYKPRGVVTTRSDEKNRKTVYDLLPASLSHLHPVGRLDLATTGLLLMTTDTQLSNFLTDPDNGIPRIYTLTVQGRITDEHIKLLLKGIQDKTEVLKASKITLLKASNKESHLTIELCEGKNREIRRMFEFLGSQVTRLKRVAYGKLTLGDLSPGQFKEVAEKEIV